MSDIKLGEMKILSLSFNDEENVFTVGSTDGFAVYDCYPLAERFKRTTFGKGIKIVEILGKSNILALVGGGENPAFPTNKVIIWNDETCECIAEIEVDPQTQILGVKLQLDKIYVVQEDQVLVFDTRNLNLIQTVQTNKNINGLCITRNKVMATLGKKVGEIVIHRDGKERVIKPHSDYVVRMSFNKDASLIASASRNGRNIYVYDTRTGEQKFQFRRGSEEVDIYSISFSSPESKLLCVNSDKGTSHIWKLEEGKGTTSMLSGLTGWGASFLPKAVDDHLKNVWSDMKFAFPTDEPIYHCFVNDKQKDIIVCICLRGDYFCYSTNTSSDGSGSVTQTVYSSFGIEKCY